MIIRAVIYARCSTEDESQKDALAKQIQEAKECVRLKGWVLADAYIESRSGTTTKGRTEYNRLYRDLQEDLFDVIVIKSQDRLMRNTKDWYLFVDRLCTNGKRLYIYIERKFYTTDDALITGIKAILAEEYSRELSKKINNAHRNRQKNGGSVILTSRAYGFRKLPDKSVELIESEAQVKRRMYQLCVDGYGSRRIAKVLTNEGIRKRSGRPFSGNDVLRMLKNPLNMGTAVMNRKHFDFESKQVLNVPVERQVWHENKVPATVPEELWRKANQQIEMRACRIRQKEVYPKCTQERISGKFCFSGKIFCGLCGHPYYRRFRKTGREHNPVVEWKCSTYLLEGRKSEVKSRQQVSRTELKEEKGCDNIHLDEEKLVKLLEKVCMEQFPTDKQQVLCEIAGLLEIVLAEASGEDLLEELRKQEKNIENQQDQLVDYFLREVITKEIYERKQGKLETDLKECREKRERMERTKKYKQSKEQRIREIKKRIEEDHIVERAVVCEMLEEIEKIKVYPSYMEIYFGEERRFNKEKNRKKMEKVIIPYGTMFDCMAQKREDRQKVIEMIRKYPKITAKEIAASLGCSLSGANYKLKVLKKEGRVRFIGKGGHGFWEIMGE